MITWNKTDGNPVTSGPVDQWVTSGPQIRNIYDLIIGLNNVLFISNQKVYSKGKGKGIYFLLSATSSMPLALYNGTHTLI